MMGRVNITESHLRVNISESEIEVNIAKYETNMEEFENGR